MTWYALLPVAAQRKIFQGDWKSILYIPTLNSLIFLVANVVHSTYILFANDIIVHRVLNFSLTTNRQRSIPFPPPHRKKKKQVKYNNLCNQNFSFKIYASPSLEKYCQLGDKIFTCLKKCIAIQCIKYT